MRSKVRKPNHQVVEQFLSIPETKSADDMTLLELIETVVDAFRAGNNVEEPLNIRPALAVLSRRFGISERQALLFSMCVGEGFSRVDLDDLARALGVSLVKMLSLSSDLKALVDRQLLRYNDVNTEDCLFVPSAVLKALKRNEVYAVPNRKGLTCFEIFNLVQTWFPDLMHSYKSSKEMVEDLRNLFNDNPQVEFPRKMVEMDLSDDNLLVLCYFCDQLVNHNDDEIHISEMEFMFDNPTFRRISVSMQTGNNLLVSNKILENACMDGIASTSQFKLTEGAKSDLLSEVVVSTTQRSGKRANVLEAQTLTAKEMFYTEGNTRQVEELGEFFQDESYRQIKERMLQRGFRSGFACLFYGGPGTGKTETVYQLARQTGRDIMVVDVPQIKSKWVGDSEKNIKALFDQYRRLVKRSNIAPILLFNEADAIIGTRMKGAENAVDKMENSIQNIILQEMENLDGIMVATTNLEGNLDPAFERRFLYKIHFEKPDAGVRAKIWRQMIPELSPEEAAQLAAYDFSGGQIENIARKHAIHVILHGNSDNAHMEHLLGFCAVERLAPNARRPIGF
jgi:SpoVK/Ycf46/Vps4 family AAA+-type ATPase